MATIASFHLVRWPRRAALRGLARLALDRAPVRATPGIAFARLLGTGRGDDTSLGIEPCRTAMFAVWDDEQRLDDFLASSPVAARWDDAEEVFHVRLRALGGHGTWGGTDIVRDMERAAPGGPVAVLTHATVRATRWVRFVGAGGRVGPEVRAASGLLAVCGIGEAPIGRLGTFSLWADATDPSAFAGAPQHREVIRRANTERWYEDAIFARFAPFGAQGTWDGRRLLHA